MTKSLPARPNLEHLKHEAKAILKSLRAGVSEHAGVLRNLRRFSGKADEDILRTLAESSGGQYYAGDLDTIRRLYKILSAYF